MKYISVFILIFFATATGAFREFHVSKNGNDAQDGSATRPLRTISAAVARAFPGDTITVHAGTYREWVNPIRGGVNDTLRIVYRAATGDTVHIKGSEIVTGWQKQPGGVWKVVIPHSFFRDYNPFVDSVTGDWFNRKGRKHHTGDVFLNGKSLYEKETLEKVLAPVIDSTLKDPHGPLYAWYCNNDNNASTIWANFQRYDPNKELVEITTRRTCFYPEKPGIDFITISGFYISQAATQWAAPTAEQIGMVATHWNKGWIIENNVISDSKCSGITLGKERGTGHNVWSANRSISGTQHYLEVTFRALKNGWNKERIGSHIVRNNRIFNCEQAGICGSMGAAFSTIENNHIYDIWTKRQFDGAEIGGIKFHAAIDAVVRKNRVHNTARGIWFDWMAQGVRVSGNLLYDNHLEDLFMEVNHGPFVVDNNILLSRSAINIQSQGGAYAHNLVAGTVYVWGEPTRWTPYHLPHSTEIAGLSAIHTGDDRYYNNIFIGPGERYDSNAKYQFGLRGYAGAKLPVWMNDNIYYRGARPHEKEANAVLSSAYDPGVVLVENRDGLYLRVSFDAEYYRRKGSLITSEVLGKAKMPNAPFENPDGTPLVIDTDYFGSPRNGTTTTIGPFEHLEKSNTIIKIW
jgi:hypothetical protein